MPRAFSYKEHGHRHQHGMRCKGRGSLGCEVWDILRRFAHRQLHLDPKVVETITSAKLIFVPGEDCFLMTECFFLLGLREGLEPGQHT